MPNPMLTWSECNLYAGSAPTDDQASNHLIITEVKLPSFDEQYVDHRAGGAPVAVEINTIFNRPELTFACVGLTPQILGLINSWQRSQNQFFIYGNVRDQLTGVAMQARAAV